MNVMLQMVVLLGLVSWVAAAEDGPVNIRVEVELIALPHIELTKILSGEVKSGAALYGVVDGMVGEGKARFVETLILTSRSGQKGSVESLAELMWPMEQEGSEGLGDVVSEVGAVLAEPFSFETRNFGGTLEIEALVGDGPGAPIELRITVEEVGLLRMDPWLSSQERWGGALLSTPVFEAHQANGGWLLKQGVPEMVTIFTPRERPEERVVVFVRATVLGEGKGGGE